MFGFFEKERFEDMLRPDPEAQQMSDLIGTLDERLAENCCKKTLWYQKHPEALQANESLADAIERLYNTGREDQSEHCYECGCEHEGEPWEHVPYWAADADIDEDGYRGCSIEDRGGWDTHNWTCPVPMKLFRSMLKVAKEFSESLVRQIPVPGEVLSAIDWDYFLSNSPMIETKHRSPEEVVGDKIKEGLPEDPINVFENPAAVGERVREATVGKTGAFFSAPESREHAGVVKAREISGDRNLSDIAATVWSEADCTQSSETLPTKKESLAYRARVWLGMKVAWLATKIVPARKLEEIRYQEEEA